MADEDYSSSIFRRYLFYFSDRFLLKLGIADGQNFIHQKNLRLEVRRDSKSEAHIHSTRIALHRCIEKFFNLREGDNLIEFLANLRAAHTENCAVQENVFSPS